MLLRHSFMFKIPDISGFRSFGRNQLQSLDRCLKHYFFHSSCDLTPDFGMPFLHIPYSLLSRIPIALEMWTETLPACSRRTSTYAGLWTLSEKHLPMVKAGERKKRRVSTIWMPPHFQPMKIIFLSPKSTPQRFHLQLFDGESKCPIKCESPLAC